MEPLPLTIILHPVSCSSCFAVIPRGPNILPTKLNWKIKHVFINNSWHFEIHLTNEWEEEQKKITRAWDSSAMLLRINLLWKFSCISFQQKILELATNERLEIFFIWAWRLFQNVLCMIYRHHRNVYPSERQFKMLRTNFCSLSKYFSFLNSITALRMYVYIIDVLFYDDDSSLQIKSH